MVRTFSDARSRFVSTNFISTSGIAFFFTLQWWMRAVGPDAWIALSGLEAVFFAPLGAAAAHLQAQSAQLVQAMAVFQLDPGQTSATPARGGAPTRRLAAT